MSKMWKRALTIFMAMIMLCGFALPAELGLADGDEPVELTIFMASTRPMNECTDLTRQYVKDNIAVDMNMIQGDSTTFDQQLALYVSGGDMPDVVLCSYATYLGYAAEGAWADISPYLTDDLPDLMTYVGDYWPYLTVDGAIGGVPRLLNVPSSHVVSIRKDWLDNLGLEEPKTLEEYTEVMRAFTFNDPDKDGKNDTYGLSAAGYSYLSFLMGAFGASSERDYFLNDDGTITTNAISEEYRDALRYLNSIYTEGLIDPELFTCTYEQAQAKWGRGEMGIWSNWWSHAGNAYYRFDFGNLQPDAVVTHLLPPVGPEGKSGNLYATPFDAVVSVSYLCDQAKIEAALRLLNFNASPLGFRVLMYGIPGEFFEWDEANNMTTWTTELNGGVSKSGKYTTTDMEVYKLLYQERWQGQSDALYSGPEGKLWYGGGELRYQEPVREDVFCMFLTDEYIKYHAELDSYFKTSMIAFIMGEKDIENDWDAYVAEYMNMGGDIERQSQLKVYNDTFNTQCVFAE